MPHCQQATSGELLGRGLPGAPTWLSPRVPTVPGAVLEQCGERGELVVCGGPGRCRQSSPTATTTMQLHLNPVLPKLLGHTHAPFIFTKKRLTSCHAGAPRSALWETLVKGTGHGSSCGGQQPPGGRLGTDRCG